jgi:hypothetical protein
VHAALNLFLMALLFIKLEVGLAGKKLSISIIFGFSEFISTYSREPSTDAALDKESGLFALLGPHLAREVLPGVDDFIVSAVNEETSSFHLAALLSHHVRRLGLVLVSLNLALKLVGVVVGDLVGLRKGVVVVHSAAVVTETAEVGLGPLLFVNGDSHDFYLVVSHADFDLELVGHDKLVSLNRVVVIGLLLLLALVYVVRLLLHLLLHLLLLRHLLFGHWLRELGLF